MPAASTIPPACDGLAHFVSQTIDRGTSSRTADQIAEELDSRGVSLTVTVNRHAMSLVCTCLVEDFEPILALVADIADAAGVSRRRRSRRGAARSSRCIRQDEDNPATVAMRSG